MRLPWMRGYVESAAWLSDDTLLAIGWCLAPTDSVKAYLDCDSGAVPLDARWIGYPRADLNGPYPAGRVMTIQFPTPRFAHPLSGNIVIEGSGARFTATAVALNKVTTDAVTAIRSRVGWLDPRTRGDIITFLLATLERPSASLAQLCSNLHAVRDVLRDAAPGSETRGGERNGVQLDHVLRIDRQSFYLRGWAYDAFSRPTRVTAVTPEGRRIELLERAFRYARPDVEAIYGPAAAKAGFIAHVHLEEPSLVPHGWIAEVAGGDGVLCEAPGPPVVADRTVVRERLLADLDLEPPFSTRLLENHTFPALNRVQELDGLEAAVENVVDFGVSESAPDLSIVIPLYRRIDLLEQQLSQFVDDPEIRRAELIYVLDSPELADTLRESAGQLYELYRTPFRVVFLERGVGFALANNLGVSVARGRLVLLLNSDVFPARPGWSMKMTEFYDSKPRIGALGPKLLFEDDTLQHAGLYFHRSDGRSVWVNRHYYKGFERRLPAANVARVVPAVTAACMMINREVYLAQGGLRGAYVQGDYEDSDFCLKLIGAGYENWYLPDVELYHLEGQSFGWERRARTSRYNAWLHTHLWGETIEAVMARFGS